MTTEPAPVVISPFANERARQWPAAHYRDLIELIWREHGLRSLIVGTRAQRIPANEIVRGLSSEVVANSCGTLSWLELVAAVNGAPYVVANNSGVAHLAAAAGRRTLCVFSATHSPLEWAPRGPFVVTLTRLVACAPCSLGHALCPNGMACMTDLTPAEAFWRFDRVIAATGEPIKQTA